MESYKISQSESNIPPNVEAIAAYEGNYTELLVERVTDPHIKRQIVDLLLKNEMNTVLNNRKNLVPHGKPDEKLVRDPDGNILSSEYFNFKEPSLKNIEADFYKRIKEITERTPISFSPSEFSSIKAVCVNSVFPGQEKKMTAKQLNIVEAHEKGHVIRPYVGAFFDYYFGKGFNPSRTVFSEQDPIIALVIDKLEVNEKLTPHAIRKHFNEYLFSAHEIAERMSQLKNYFGMRGADIFTKEHLDYARKHYVRDTGLDNHMTQFFQAITHETERIFIELINTSGI